MYEGVSVMTIAYIIRVDNITQNEFISVAFSVFAGACTNIAL